MVTRSHLEPDHDRLLTARLDGIAVRHARWGGLTEAGKAGGAAQLRQAPGGCGDLLARVAGLPLGAAGIRGPEYQARPVVTPPAITGFKRWRPVKLPRVGGP